MPPSNFRPASIRSFLLLLVPLILFGCWQHDSEASLSTLRRDGELKFFCSDNSAKATISIEIADSTASHTRGLMGRHLRDDSEGMLFIFETPDIRHFWMRNTPGSLDMIFVAEDRQILNIAERTLPLSDRTYSSAGAAAYVVEVRGGFARRLGINQSCHIDWHRY